MFIFDEIDASRRVLTFIDRRTEMTNGKNVSQKVVLLAVFMVFGLALFSGVTMAVETAVNISTTRRSPHKLIVVIVKDPDAHYLKIDVTTTQGDVVLTGFVNSRATEERLVAKIRQIKGVKSVKSLLKVEERK